MTHSRIKYGFSALTNNNFLLLWLGMLFLMCGTQMQMMARGYLVYDLTARPLLLGVVNASGAIPILSLSLVGGAIADKVNRKRIVQIAQLMSMAVAVFVGISISIGTVTWVHLLIASICQGGMWSFMMPARQAMIPEVAGKEHTTNGLALNAAGMSAMTLIAPAIAGTLYAGLGADTVYFLIAMLNFIAVILTSLIDYNPTNRFTDRSPIFGQIKDGIGYIFGMPLVLLLLVIGLATTMLAVPFRFLISVYVVEVYNMGPDAVGLLMSMMGLGTLVGAIFIVALGKWHRGILLVAGTFVSGIGLVMVAGIPYYIPGIFIMIIIGLGDASRRSLNQTLILEAVDDAYRGRVMSVFMMNFGLMPLGVLPAGYLMERIGEEWTVALLGIGMIVVALTVFGTQKQLRLLS